MHDFRKLDAAGGFQLRAERIRVNARTVELGNLYPAQIEHFLQIPLVKWRRFVKKKMFFCRYYPIIVGLTPVISHSPLVWRDKSWKGFTVTGRSMHINLNQDNASGFWMEVIVPRTKPIRRMTCAERWGFIIHHKGAWCCIVASYSGTFVQKVF